MTTTSAPNQATPSPVRRAIGITLAAIAAIVVAFFVFASLYADWLWFDQLGYSSVLWTQWSARAIMFAIGFVAMVLATANVVGGWFVTDRMLEMFKRRPTDPRER